MKIWGELPRIQGIYGKQKSYAKISKASEIASKEDVVSISNHAKDFQTALKALKDVPDIREEKVNELLERFESGTYNVKGREIADKIIKSSLDKRG